MEKSLKILKNCNFIFQVLAIEHSMRKPWNYTKVCGVLNWGMGFLIGLHVIVGAVVYAQWGTDSLANFIRNHHEHNA